MKWPPAGRADGKSGGSKPLRAGGRIPLSGVVLAALPTQASRQSHLQSMQAQKTHQFVGGGYRSKRSFDAPWVRTYADPMPGVKRAPTTSRSWVSQTVRMAPAEDRGTAATAAPPAPSDRSGPAA